MLCRLVEIGPNVAPKSTKSLKLNFLLYTVLADLIFSSSPHPDQLGGGVFSPLFSSRLSLIVYLVFCVCVFQSRNNGSFISSKE